MTGNTLIEPWGLLGAPGETPYVTESSDPRLAPVLTTTWRHDQVLPHLPG